MLEEIIKNKENAIVEDLNDKQKEALYYFDGPLRIIAGAGTGKTRVLTRKMAFLINILGIAPSKILAVTFTSKAANEMADRVKQYTNPKFITGKVTIQTFNTLCGKILREEAEFANLKKDFQIIDDVDKKNILKIVFQNLDYEANDANFKNILRIFSWAKNKRYSVNDIVEHIDHDLDSDFAGNGEKVAKIYNEYNKYLAKLKCLDFDDLVIKVNELFDKHPRIAKKWADRYSYILVDEFQDTSTAQYDVIKVLASSNAQITIVGDPDQTIYRWRGADVNLILNFDKDFKKTKTIILNKNYRSTQNILNVANSLIKYNKNRYNKDLIAEKEAGPEIDFMHAFSPEAEARWVVQKINELKKQKKQLKSIAVFYRTDSFSRYLEEQLINENINYRVFGSEKFYQRKEIKDALAFLRVIYDGSDLSLIRVLNVPPRKITEEDIRKLQTFAQEKGLSLFNTLIKYYRELPVSFDIKKSIVKFLNKINKFKKALTMNPIATTLEKFLEEIGYFEYINEDVGLRGTGEESVNTLIDGIETWQKENPKKKIEDYFEYVSFMSTRDTANDALSYVSLMTVHAAKGLEFENVFLVGMSEQLFPHYVDKEINEETLEEERRLAYVAITRAKNRLFISDSRGMLFNTDKEKEPSRFLKEMGININKFILQPDNTIIIEDSEEETEKIPKEVNRKIIAGDVISHTFFGEGEVLEVSGDTILVHFAKNGVKSLAKNHHSIRVLKDEGE